MDGWSGIYLSFLDGWVVSIFSRDIAIIKNFLIIAARSPTLLFDGCFFFGLTDGSFVNLGFFFGEPLVDLIFFSYIVKNCCSCQVP